MDAGSYSAGVLYKPKSARTHLRARIAACVKFLFWRRHSLQFVDREHAKPLKRLAARTQVAAKRKGAEEKGVKMKISAFVASIKGEAIIKHRG